MYEKIDLEKKEAIDPGAAVSKFLQLPSCCSIINKVHAQCAFHEISERINAMQINCMRNKWMHNKRAAQEKKMN